MRFEEYLLEDVLDIKYGKNQKKVKDDNGPYPILGTGGLMGYATEYLYDKPSVLIGRKGSISKVRYIDEPFWTVDTLFYTIVNEEIVYPKFIYYYLSQIDFNYYNEGTTIPSLRTQTLNQIILNLPDLKYQAKILKMVNPIEERIELNNSIISNLEELAQTLFKRWFVDFEFPNEEGKPYKSSGGKMVESELGMIPEGWRHEVLKNITINSDRKRIPLSKLEREKRKSIYPYYGAASLMDYVDDYIFEGVHVLVGEDGTVIDDKGYPIMQYVWGKFWVNNHAHVLQGKGDFSSEYIYLLLKRTNVTNIVTGAVQPKINQTNLNKISVIVPDKETLNSFDEIINSIFTEIRSLKDESDSFVSLRDTLLPKLLSGEIELSNETEVMDDVPIS